MSKKPYLRSPWVELDMNVWDAAIGRMRWLFDEFDGNVNVSISGGKDSTVIMELAAMVARERGQKLKVKFLDQEAEWQGTIDYLREVAARPDIHMDWYQIPFRLFNSTSYEEEWGCLWPEEEPEGGYMRPPEPNAIRVNDFGDDRFHPLMHAINAREGGVHLTGMRIEEAPTRRLGSTRDVAYKWATWGSKSHAHARAGAKPYFIMHPIYDWSYRDVWKAIHDNDWAYNRVYDDMYQYGVSTKNLRVSSLIHEHAGLGLVTVQEIDPETWDSMCRRFPGINAYGHVGQMIEDEFRYVRPWMFDNWTEYLEYLIDNLIAPEHREAFRLMKADAMEKLPWMHEDRINQQIIKQVMRNDYWIKLGAYPKWLYTNQVFASHYEDTTGKTLPPRSFKFVERRSKH